MEDIFGNIDNKFILVKKIGSGGTSKVYLGYKINEKNKLFAIKVIKPTSSSDSKIFTNEVNMLKKVDHKNVAKLICGGEGILTKFDGKKSMIQYLVLELIKYGELFDYIFFPQKGLGEDVGKYVILQILDGLESIHKNGIVHRDMKTENIMLDINWIPKIADFGFATKKEGKKGNGLLYTALGTASYASPELLQKKPYTGIESDIFSLGVSMFILVTGKMPFKHALIDDAYYKEIAKLNFERYWEKLINKVPKVSKEFKDLFVRLIAYDPNLRPTINEIRESKWFKNYIPNKENIDREFFERTLIINEKKELERVKEEEEEKKAFEKNKFAVYKGDDKDLSFDNTSNEYYIREANINDNNPYYLKFKISEKPGELLDYVYNKLLLLNEIDVIKHEEKYKFTIINKKNIEIDIETQYIEEVEALIELKRSEDCLILEFSKERGNKIDFFTLYSSIKEVLA